MKTISPFSIFNEFPNLLIELSLREYGNMKVHNELERDKEILANREKFLDRLGLSRKEVVSAKLVHEDNVAIVFSENKGQFIPQTDGLITNQKGVYLSITIADCLPVVIFDSKKEVISLLHCGWRGLEKEIIKKAIKKMKREFDVKPEELVAGIGPGIGSCHFEVKTDVLKKLKSYPEAIVKKDDKNFIDLKLIAKHQLEEVGIKSDSIEVSPVCTYCQSKTYFSFRNDKSNPLQAMMFIVGIKLK